MANDIDDGQLAYMVVQEEEVSIGIHPYTGPQAVDANFWHASKG